MGRFDSLATQPRRTFGDIFRWKVTDNLLGRNRKDPGGFVTPRRAPDHAAVQGVAPQLTWIGHASFLLTLGGMRFLIDPVLAPRIGPVPRLTAPGLSLEELPPIDAVLLTHNHRDHLDTWTLERLAGSPRVIAPLGHSDLLGDLGFSEITELAWWDQCEVGGVTVSLVPARHWSMRFPWDRNDMLWGGFVLQSPQGNAYHSGDTSFFEGVAEIGRRLGPIDWAMLPIGAYEPRWFMEPQHMDPTEAVRTARLVGARNLVAMHWGTFRLTDEPIAEPPVRAREAYGAAGGDPSGLWILDIGETRRL